MLAAIGWPADLYRDFDFMPMWLAGRGVLQGTDFYDPVVWRELFIREGSQGYAYLPGSGFGYAMPAAVLMAPFGLLPFSLAAALWATTMVALTVSGTYALGRLLFRQDPRRDLFVLVGLSLGSAPFWLSLVTGQVSGLMLGLVAHATALLASRPTVAGALLGLAGILKPQIFVWAIPILLIASPGRVAILKGLVLLGAPLLAISFLVRPDWPGAWLSSAVLLQSLEVSRANAWGLAPANAQWLGWVSLGIIVLAFVLWWRAGPSLLWLWAGALALSLFAAPYSYAHNFGPLVVPAALVVATVAGASAPTRAWMLGVLALVWVVVPWVLQIETHRTGAEPAAGLVPVAMLALLIVAHRMRSRA